VQKLEKPKKSKPFRIAVYDFETAQENEIKPGSLEHKVAYVSLRWTCTSCLDEGENPFCEICNPASQKFPLSRSKSWSWYNSNDPLYDFVYFVLKEFEKKHETILFAHNGGRFDAHFVLQILYQMKLEPKLVMTGLKIYNISIKLNRSAGLCHFRDSYLILQTPLDSLKKTFDLKVEEKMHFPYLFCKRENMHLELKHLPPIDDYIPSTMKPEKHAKFQVFFCFSSIIHYFLLRNGMRRTKAHPSHCVIRLPIIVKTTH
jgi:hypothetical protein